MIFQTSCSELLVDTAIHEPDEAYKKFSGLFAELEWETSPPLSVALLTVVKEIADDYDKGLEVLVYDKEGNRAWIEYGENGYIQTGYRFDSHCAHGDRRCFPIFKQALDKLAGKMIACDGGGTECYEDWVEGIVEEEDDE